MKNTNWKYLGEAILFSIQLVAIIAIGFGLILAPAILLGDKFWIIYAFYGIVIIVIATYSNIARGEYVEEVYTGEGRIKGVISYYENKGMRVVDHRMFDYKARVYYNKETNTITLT